MTRTLRAMLWLTVCVVGAGCSGGEATTLPVASPAAQRSLAAQAPSASPIGGPATSPSTGAATPLPELTDAPSTASPTSEPTARPTPGPTDPPPASPVPTPRPRVGLVLGGRSTSSWNVRVNPGRSFATELQVRTRELDQRRCKLTHAIEPDKPEHEASKETLRPVDAQRVSFIDGRHELRVTCPSAVGTLRDRIVVVVADGEPERCRGFEFPSAEITVNTLEQLTSGMVGTWHGCVTTPWTIAYGVDVKFRSDGTYSARSGEVLDGQAMTALYYGTDEDSTLKRWWINDLQASDKGVGEIDIVFGESNVNRDELRNVKLMGDQLEFELFHQGVYGPVLVQLFRD